MLEHVRARARRDDDIPIRFFEDADRMFHDRTRLGAQAGVEGRLSTACLIGREIHGQAQAAENTDDCLACLWIEGIDEAGDEELHCRHKSIVIRFPFPKINCESQKFGIIPCYEYISHSFTRWI